MPTTRVSWLKRILASYHVRTDGEVLPCAISPRLRKQLIYPIADPNSLSHIVREVKILDKVDPVAVGDMVRFVDTHDGSGMITEVLPRRNRLARRDPYPGTHKFEQIIVCERGLRHPGLCRGQPNPQMGPARPLPDFGRITGPLGVGGDHQAGSGPRSGGGAG